MRLDLHRMRDFIKLCAMAAGCLACTPTLACVEGDVRGEAVSAERSVEATPAGETASFNILGAGWFRAAEITKFGGRDDNTTVTIELDGASMISTSFAALKNPWMQLNTNFILANVRTVGDVSTMTIWYSPELKFRAMAAVRVQVDEEGVKGIMMRTVMNKPAPHEHIPGQTPATVALPAFK